MKLMLKDENLKEKAEALAKDLGLEIVDECDDIHFELSNDGLALVKDGLREIGDFTKSLNRLKPNNLGGEMLIKAVKIKGRKDLVVYDMTAGMGEESLLLAAQGYETYMFERDAYICALLKDCLARSIDIPELEETIKRMHLIEGDSISKSLEVEAKPDVVYLDVMFPERNKKALVKKKFQLLHELEKPCDNEEEMLEAAMRLNPAKIVIKRPIKAKELGNIKPSYSIKGKAIRYDCLVLNNKI